MEKCLFCKIIKKESPSHIFWEDKFHIAFLNIFPNTEAAAIVITKKHYPSYIVDMPIDKAKNFFGATIKVARLLDKKLEDVGRTGIIFEGMGINHIHAKLFPMHGTKNIATKWKQFRKSKINTYFEKYEGYISSHSSQKKADDILLEKISKKLKN
jgi:diadenosine tetraphosphate (Ap4A) HIT family hydrolase